MADESFVIQRKQKDGTYVDWTNPMSGRTEYETHSHAAAALLRRANITDFRIVRRIHTFTDEPVGLYR